MSSRPPLPSLQWYLVRANQIWNGTSCKVSKGSPMSYSVSEHFSQIPPLQFQILQSLWIISAVKSCLDSLRISACQLNTSMLDLSLHQTKESSQEACWVLWMVRWQQSCERAKNKQSPTERMRPYKLPYTPCSAAAEWETDSNSSPSGALTLSTEMTLNSPSHVRDLSRGIRSETDNLFHRNVNSCTDTVSFLNLCLNFQISVLL